MQRCGTLRTSKHNWKHGNKGECNKGTGNAATPANLDATAPTKKHTRKHTATKASKEDTTQQAPRLQSHVFPVKCTVDALGYGEAGVQRAVAEALPRLTGQPSHNRTKIRGSTASLCLNHEESERGKRVRDTSGSVETSALTGRYRGKYRRSIRRGRGKSGWAHDGRDQHIPGLRDPRLAPWDPDISRAAIVAGRGPPGSGVRGGNRSPRFLEFGRDACHLSG